MILLILPIIEADLCLLNTMHSAHQAFTSCRTSELQSIAFEHQPLGNLLELYVMLRPKRLEGFL